MKADLLYFAAATGAKANGENFPAFAPVKTIEGAWEVSFDPSWGGPATVRFDRLEDWAQRPQRTGIRYYSGKATYRISFERRMRARSGPCSCRWEACATSLRCG